MNRIEPTLSVAIDLIDAVARRDAIAAQCAIDSADLTALVLVLAAMADEEQSIKRLRRDVPRLLREVTGPAIRRPKVLRPCGTHAAFVRHKARGEQPCDPCTLAEREYQRTRYRAKAVA